MTYARIVGTGSYLPEKVISNEDLEKTMDTSDEWIRERTGINEQAGGVQQRIIRLLRLHLLLRKVGCLQI